MLHLKEEKANGCTRNQVKNNVRFIEDSPRQNAIHAELIIDVKFRENTRHFQLPTFLLSVSLSLASHVHLSSSLLRSAAFTNGNVSRLTKSRPDWSSCGSFSKREIQCIKARRATGVVSFITNAIKCKCSKAVR